MDNQSTEPFLTCDESRNIDKIAIEKFGIPGIALMENASRGCVDWLEELGITGTVLIVAGKGNNGGDGFAMARHLLVRGHQVSVQMIGDPNSLSGDAKVNFEILQKISDSVLQIHESATEITADGFLAILQSYRPEWIVDGLLGTGTKGDLRSPMPEVLSAMNRCDARKFAIDLPSGFDGDTGQSLDAAFTAEYTATFVAKKIGFQHAAAKSLLGEVKVLDIGFPNFCWT